MCSPHKRICAPGAVGAPAGLRRANQQWCACNGCAHVSPHRSRGDSKQMAASRQHKWSVHHRLPLCLSPLLPLAKKITSPLSSYSDHPSTRVFFSVERSITSMVAIKQTSLKVCKNRQVSRFCPQTSIWFTFGEALCFPDIQVLSIRDDP